MLSFSKMRSLGSMSSVEFFDEKGEDSKLIEARSLMLRGTALELARLVESS